MSGYTVVGSNPAILAFVRAFLSGRRPEARIDGLAFRIIRGKQPRDFASFTDTPEGRAYVMFFGPDGGDELIGKSGWQQLLDVAKYELDYLRHKVAEGNLFKLAIIPEGPAVLATASNVVELVCKGYPDLAPIFERHRAELDPAVVPFGEIERQAGFSFLAVEKAGKEDPRFMTPEHLGEVLRERGTATLAEARAFLYFTMHLRKNWTGDGRTHAGGPLEYIAPNMRLEARPPLDATLAHLPQVAEYALIDLDVAEPVSSLAEASVS